MSQEQRAIEVTALTVAGLTQHEIAKELGVARSTVQRDLESVKPGLAAAEAKLAEMQARIAEVMPPRARINHLVELLQVAKETKQPSAGLAIVNRFDDLDGVLTSKDRLKAEGGAPTAPGPMFVFAGDVSIDYGRAAAPLSTNDVVDATTIDVVDEADRSGR